MLLTDLGAAGMGLLILSSCGGSSSDAPVTPPVDLDDPNAEPIETTIPVTDDAAGREAEPSTEATTTEATTTEATTTTEGAPEVSERLEWQHVWLDFVSAYVLVRGREAAVVDTGTSGSGPAILEGLGALGASWSDVRHVVLTHNHGDHIGGLGEVIVEAPGATLYAGEADIAGIQVAAPLQAVGDGDEVFGLGVLNTPGHTPGSISLFDVDTGLLVAGDAINGDNGVLIGANPQFSSDMAEAGRSIAKLAALNPQVAAFGHGGPPITDDVAAQLAALAPS